MRFGIQRAGIGGRIGTRIKFGARATLWTEKRWDGILYDRRIGLRARKVIRWRKVR